MATTNGEFGYAERLRAEFGRRLRISAPEFIILARTRPETYHRPSRGAVWRSQLSFATSRTAPRSALVAIAA